ncbi:MAG: GGDEF domain-containing protein [Candidatus Coproplasma sp.]
MFDFYDATTVITLIILLITFADAIANKIISNGKKGIVITISLLIALAAVCEWAGVKCDGAAPELIQLHYAVKFIEFIVTPFIGFAAANAYGYPKSQKSMIVLLLINMIIQTVSLSEGWIFYIDASIVYHRAGMYWVYVLAFTISVLFCIVSILAGNKNYRFRIDFTQVLAIVLLATGIIIQMVMSSIRIDFLCLAIGNYMLYTCYGNAIMRLDALTKLFTRRCYEINLRSAPRNVTVVFFDVNDFKLVNDVYGHAQGDECLRKVGAAIHSVYSKSGNCYRIGGDEFCVILNKKAETVRLLNLKFNDAIKTLRKDDPKMPTVAVGFAKRESSDSSIEVTLNRADEMMYENKKQQKERERAKKENNQNGRQA